MTGATLGAPAGPRPPALVIHPSSQCSVRVRFRRPTRLALARVGVAVLAVPAAQQAAARDLTFTYRVRRSAAGADQRDRNSPAANLLATVRTSGTNARVDFQEGGVPMAPRGGYTLARGADRQPVLVNPRDRRAVLPDADVLGAGRAAVTNDALVRVNVRDPRVAVEELGAGERIHGRTR